METKNDIQEVAHTKAIKRRGGPGRGQGRKAEPLTPRLIPTRFTTEADWKFVLDNTTPAERFALILAHAKVKQAKEQE